VKKPSRSSPPLLAEQFRHAIEYLGAEPRHQPPYGIDVRTRPRVDRDVMQSRLIDIERMIVLRFPDVEGEFEALTLTATRVPA
jgi:hypothetical protein